jgi:uncharacterized protein
METYIKDKRISFSVLVLLGVLSLFVFVKFINEIKLNSYIGRDSQLSNVISVSGSGEVLAVADIASLSLNLSKEGLTAKESQDLLNELVEETLIYLKEQNIEDKDIKSEYGGLNPKYSYERCYTYPCPSTQKIVGYTASQSIVVKIREVDTANDIRTGLADLGVTDITGPTFSIDDEKVFQEEARNMAIEEAKGKAETLAQALGVRLGRVVNFSEGNGDFYPMYQSPKLMDMAQEASSSAPVLPKGENKIISNVSITYEIR